MSWQRSTTLFRITNFELFMKPSKFIMIGGVVALSVGTAYALYDIRRVQQTPEHQRINSTDPKVLQQQAIEAEQQRIREEWQRESAKRRKPDSQ